MQRVGVPFGDDFHAAVVLIAHVTLDAFALRGSLDEEPEPDALHTPFHDVSPSDEHAELYMGRVGHVGHVGRGARGQRKRALAIASALVRSIDP